ncbi:hypothetical protein EV643_103370 [Kribbella sp. VKM Ac-2527]|uniref:DDE family transposase n=1 Tax=Kribbella caucasensis TaxID=2512215 RepID=A0A4R6KKV7_9ACTN|nr:hypothetical protein EV643_103370 [Kribbella sp. VKM Ac-2527]
MPLFDDEHLVSCAGLVPVMTLAEQAGLSELVAERVGLGATGVKSAGVNPAGKVTSVVAGMAAEADSIDDLQVIRSGGMNRLFEQVNRPGFGRDSSLGSSQAARGIRSPSSYSASNSAGGLYPQAP